MPPRKDRIAVVLDTNVVLGYYLSRRPQSATVRVFKLWRDERKLQLVVSRPMVDEDLAVLERLQVGNRQIELLAARFENRSTVTYVQLGARPHASRDPNDNPILATALAGRAKYLVTNDHDLLDIETAEKRKFKFEIVTPARLLTLLKFDKDHGSVSLRKR